MVGNWGAPNTEHGGVESWVGLCPVAQVLGRFGKKGGTPGLEDGGGSSPLDISESVRPFLFSIGLNSEIS